MDDLLAQIDDAKPKMEVRVAKAKVAVAKEKATDDINIRYAKASAAGGQGRLPGEQGGQRQGQRAWCPTWCSATS